MTAIITTPIEGRVLKPDPIVSPQGVLVDFDARQYDLDHYAGMQDCLEGEPAKENASDAYYRGYNKQYQLDAIQDSKEFI